MSIPLERMKGSKSSLKAALMFSGVHVISDGDELSFAFLA